MSRDPVELTRQLVRCRTVTPEEGGAIALLESTLREAGFDCFRADRGGVSNLVARWGERAAARTFGFNGHADVVPPGDPETWSADPFAAEERDGWLYGRGAVDMKSGVAAFVSAAISIVQESPPEGAIIISITGDEEGEATDGTTAILDWMSANGEAMSDCIVGEPTSVEALGDTIKIGRRGSMSAHFTAIGLQGHTAYPDRARNPVHVLARLMDRFASHKLDDGTEHFQPSTLAVTTMDTGNAATNVIPAACKAALNIRFNDAHSSNSLTAWLEEEAARAEAESGVEISMETKVSGESFVTPPGAFSELVSEAILAETGLLPEHSTTGGSSDARFIMRHCPVVEFGLVGKTMHEVDERVEIAQIARLAAVYRRILDRYFA